MLVRVDWASSFGGFGAEGAMGSGDLGVLDWVTVFNRIGLSQLRCISE